MAKRFADTDKYKKGFIRGLKGPYKLLWDYICLDCSHAGVWQVDFQIAQIYLGTDMPVNEKDALDAFNADEERIVVLNNGKKWFILPFVEFQYGHLNPANRVHASVIQEAEKEGLWFDAENGRISPLQGPSYGPMDKDKDKDKDKDTKGSGEKKTPAPTFTLPEWIPADVWSAYVEMRKKKRAPLTPKAVELTIEKLARFKAEGHDPVEIINRSIMHSWTGVFAPDSGRASPSRPSQVHPLSHEVVSKKNFKEGAPANWFDPPPRKEPAKFEEEFTGGEDGK